MLYHHHIKINKNCTITFFFFCLFYSTFILISLMQGMKTEKKANKRMSLNPNTPNQHFLIQTVQKGNVTEVEVSSGVQQQSVSSISNMEQYSGDDLQKIFDAIGGGKETITVQDLYSILQEDAVEMIALVDQNRKGYITRKQFFKFFNTKNYCDEEKVPPLSQEMIQNKKWVRAIEDNWEEMKEFQDLEYCKYVAKKVAEFQDSHRGI